MKLLPLILASSLAVLGATAAELKLDFSSYPINDIPKGFRSLRLGEGPVGDWKIVGDTTTALPNFAAAGTTRVPVLAQISQDRTDERYPIFLYDKEIFRDFTFTTKFKVMAGVDEQMAGIVFRAQDEKNFYVFRANTKEGNVRFYTVKDGRRTEPIGNNMPLATNEWHTLRVECQGNRIQCSINDKPLGNFLTDSTFREGKVGFWTKSDSVTYFRDAVINFTPKESLAQTMISDAVKRYPRVRGVSIYAVPEGKTDPEIIASTDAKAVGKTGGKVEKDVLNRGTIYQDKRISDVLVYMPLHDRNGDSVAVACLTLETFWGQTEKNVIMRAMPVIKQMESHIQSVKELF